MSARSHWATGAYKDAIGRRLLKDWTRLANHAGIHPADQPRFGQGCETGAAWEWLEARGRLGQLPDLLRSVDRGDLADDAEITVRGGAPFGQLDQQVRHRSIPAHDH